MRRGLIMLSLIIFIMLIPTTTAHADVVWDDTFWPQHRDELLVVNRSFYVNSASGRTVERERPGAGRQLNYFENGQLVRISRVYVRRGRYFGIPQVSGHGDNTRGWIPMDDLLLRYEPIDFLSEREDEIFIYDDDLDALGGVTRLVLWPWPGSDRGRRIINVDDMSFTDFDNFDEFIMDTLSTFNAYIDYQYRTWVQVSFQIFGGGWGREHVGGWVCLYDPEGVLDIIAFNPTPDPIAWRPGESPNWSNISNRLPPGTNDLAEPPGSDNRHEPIGIGGEAEPSDTSNTTFTILIIFISAIVLAAIIFVLIKVFKNHKNRDAK